MQVLDTPVGFCICHSIIYPLFLYSLWPLRLASLTVAASSSCAAPSQPTLIGWKIDFDAAFEIEISLMLFLAVFLLLLLSILFSASLFLSSFFHFQNFLHLALGSLFIINLPSIEFPSLSLTLRYYISPLLLFFVFLYLLLHYFPIKIYSISKRVRRPLNCYKSCFNLTVVAN